MDFPGPGSYNPEKAQLSNRKGAIGESISPQRISGVTIPKNSQERCVFNEGEVVSPGPAMYSTAMASDRMNAACWVKNKSNSNFDRQKRSFDSRSLSNMESLPGPGQYWEGLVDSKLQTCKGSKFPMNARKTIFDIIEQAREKRPGPAEYTTRRMFDNRKVVDYEKRLVTSSLSSASSKNFGVLPINASSRQSNVKSRTKVRNNFNTHNIEESACDQSDTVRLTSKSALQTPFDLLYGPQNLNLMLHTFRKPKTSRKKHATTMQLDQNNRQPNTSTIGTSCYYDKGKSSSRSRVRSLERQGTERSKIVAKPKNSEKKLGAKMFNYRDLQNLKALIEQGQLNSLSPANKGLKSLIMSQEKRKRKKKN